MSERFAHMYIAELQNRLKDYYIGHPTRIALVIQIDSIKKVMRDTGHTGFD